MQGSIQVRSLTTIALFSPSSLPNDVSGDVSFEELRWESYSAARQGALLQQVVRWIVIVPVIFPVVFPVLRAPTPFFQNPDR
jgi:hypothetical protein